MTPSDTTAFLLDGRTIKATGNLDTAYFNDPAYNRQFDAAARLTGAARYHAYTQIDTDLTRNAAPYVPISNSLIQAFYSARIGCQHYAPAVMNTDLAALCIRGHAR